MRLPLRLTWLFAVVAVMAAACAAPIQRPLAVTAPAPFQLSQQSRSPRYSAQSRPSIGVAFGGGSARGIAHVGVIRWLAEHRIPIDLAAGTSMGGLIGGSFATGMDADEIATMLGGIDWDVMFGSSNFAYKNIRRKTDSRAYPTRLEFGLKGGIVAPTALNNGEQIELLLGRIAGPYADIDHFDRLPTPFRAVAVDLVSASEVVMDRGSLAQAMRATMSLPLIFPPVERDGRVLVDGGAMNNVPADVVRAMGADRVIAVNVGDLNDREGINYSMSGLAGATLDAMMRASTKASITSADVILDVPLAAYGSLDWRRSDDLIREGYAAAEAMRDRLLPLAVTEAEYEQWRQDRQSRRHQVLPIPTFVRLDGVADNDARRLNALLERHVGVPMDMPAIEKDLAELSRARPLRDDHLARGEERGRRERPARQRPHQDLRAAVHDAGAESGEHHVEHLPHHRHGALPGVRGGHFGLRAENRRHVGVGSCRLGRVLSADCLERLLHRALCRRHHVDVQRD